MHDFTGTLCAPVSYDEKSDKSSQGGVSSTKGNAAAGSSEAPVSPSKFASDRGAGETLTQLGIKNFAQRGERRRLIYFSVVVS